MHVPLIICFFAIFKEQCVIIYNLLCCYQDSGSVIYISKFPTSCIIHILTYLKEVVSNESF